MYQLRIGTGPVDPAESVGQNPLDLNNPACRIACPPIVRLERNLALRRTIPNLFLSVAERTPILPPPPPRERALHRESSGNYYLPENALVMDLAAALFHRFFGLREYAVIRFDLPVGDQ